MSSKASVDAQMCRKAVPAPSLPSRHAGAVVCYPTNEQSNNKPGFCDTVTVEIGPPRRFAATQEDGRFPTYRVADLGLRRIRSVSAALRESPERCSSLPLTHCSRRAGAQHWCGEPAFNRPNVRVRRSNSNAGAACCQHGSLTPKTASVLVSVLGQDLPKQYRADHACSPFISGPCA